MDDIPDEEESVPKRPRKDKSKKDRKERKEKKEKRKKTHTVHTDPSPGELLMQRLEKEMDDIHLEYGLSPTCEEESMLPDAVAKRETDLHAACTLGNSS